MEDTLQRLLAVRDQLDRIQQAILSDSLSNAVDLLQDVDAKVATTSVSPDARAAAVFSARSTELRQEVAERLKQSWNSYIDVEQDAMSIVMRRQPKREFL